MNPLGEFPWLNCITLRHPSPGVQPAGRFLAGDIDSPEAMLFAEDGADSSEDFVAKYGSDQPLGLLVRQIIGLDQNAAKDARDSSPLSSTFVFYAPTWSGVLFLRGGVLSVGRGLRQQRW